MKHVTWFRIITVSLYIRQSAYIPSTTTNYLHPSLVACDHLVRIFLAGLCRRTVEFACIPCFYTPKEWNRLPPFLYRSSVQIHLLQKEAKKTRALRMLPRVATSDNSWAPPIFGGWRTAVSFLGNREF